MINFQEPHDLIIIGITALCLGIVKGAWWLANKLKNDCKEDNPIIKKKDLLEHEQKYYDMFVKKEDHNKFESKVDREFNEVRGKLDDIDSKQDKLFVAFEAFKTTQDLILKYFEMMPKRKSD